jgi:glycine/D-amino acid oxidase-like deaminating enzyme
MRIDDAKCLHVFTATKVEYVSDVPQQPIIAVVGAGIIGSAVACALARDGRRVILIDRAPPGEAGASYGNAGHVATELVETLPAPALLAGFWRELTAFGGVLDIPLRRLAVFAPWALRFAAAAFRQRENTAKLAPLVRPAVPALIAFLGELGRGDLIRQHGHYQAWLRGGGQPAADRQAAHMHRLDVETRPAPEEVLESIRRAARAETAAGLWFPRCAHVLDPLEVVRAFAHGAMERGASFLRREVRALRVSGGALEVVTDSEPVVAHTVVVCLGVWSAPLLAPFGLRAPLEAVRGYHIQMPDAVPLVDAPIVYSDKNIVVTPMARRVRATSYMEFAGAAAPPDPRKTAWLRRCVREFGYACADDAESWVGPRPVLPDYLPAMGRVAAVPNLCYAFGHQHIGLTLSAVTAHAMADFIAGRPRPELEAYDLKRFSLI